MYVDSQHTRSLSPSSLFAGAETNKHEATRQHCWTFCLISNILHTQIQPLSLSLSLPLARLSFFLPFFFFQVPLVVQPDDSVHAPFHGFSNHVHRLESGLSRRQNSCQVSPSARREGECEGCEIGICVETIVAVLN